MSGTISTGNSQSRLRSAVTRERLTGIEVLVLAPIAGVLVLWLIPNWFQVEWGCISAAGLGHTSGDTYITTFAVFGTLGWLLVVMAVLFANVTGSSRIAAILPATWFVVLVGAAALTAASIGPALCS